MVVGEKAVVNAEVYVNVAVIMGELNGLVEARERIEVYPPGRVGGDIQAPVISIEPGGVFNGSCVMKSRPEKDEKPAIFVKNQSPGVKTSAK